MTFPFLIESVSVEQMGYLASTCERWRQLALSTDRINRPSLPSAVRGLYRELSLPEPAEFLFLDSPQAALDDYPSWEKTTGRVARFFWPFQLPLFDPTAYWRAWSKWPNLDLAIRRKPNRYGCYCFGEALSSDGGVLSVAAHKQVWDAVVRHLPRPDWCETLVFESEDHYAIQALDYRVDKEEPTFQANPLEFFTLGPELWLLREVAALEFASSTLGCRVNRPLLDALLGILINGSLLFTFERLVIAIDRPVAFIDGRPRYRSP